MMIPTNMPTVRVLAGKPCSRRSQWVAVLPECSCGSFHVFRIPDEAPLFAGVLERQCPTTGTRYVLQAAR